METVPIVRCPVHRRERTFLGKMFQGRVGRDDVTTSHTLRIDRDVRGDRASVRPRDLRHSTTGDALVDDARLIIHTYSNRALCNQECG